MALTLRQVKGDALTYEEMDDNLTYLEGLTLSGINLPSQIDNSDALLNGLVVDDIYKTPTGEIRIVI